MKAHPIIFSSPMVRAILEGRKTQTRRLVKFPRQKTTDGKPWLWWPERAWVDRGFPTDDAGEILPMVVWKHANPEQYRRWYLHVPNAHPDDFSRFGSDCEFVDRVYPPWRPGDLLWVRESYYDRGDYAIIGKYRDDRIVYVADGVRAGWKIHTPIFMPRWASRITLRVTRVRVERVQEISVQDAIAEGSPIEFSSNPNDYFGWYQRTWDQLHRKHPWASNPWVWVVEFERQK